MKKEKPTDISVKTTEQSIALISPEDLEVQIATETKKRKLITMFITDHLKEGVDFGKIHVYKNCPNHKTPWLCKNQYHYSKNTLFKPGAEKFGSLFKMRSAFKRDLETWEMLGSPAGTICYICNLFTTKDILVGEGRGAAGVAEKGNPNTAIKIAKKRAFVDAVLSTGALSDFFTQDLEDMKDLEPEVEDVQTPKPKEPISDISKIKHLCTLLNVEWDTFTPRDIKELTGLEMIEQNYSGIIATLETLVKQKK